jgi:hypothetical protein
MHPDDLVRSPNDCRKLGDAERRGIGSQDRVRRADFIQLSKNLLLEVEIFRDGLDDEVSVFSCLG